MEQLVIVLSTFLLSTSIFIFSVAKGGINRRFLYVDNIGLGILSSLVNLGIYYTINMPFWLLVPFISGFVVLVFYILNLLWRFYRNPPRVIPGDKNDIVSGADGRVIYIRELEANQMPVSVKKLRIANISEITKTEILKQPCYLVGIAMTLFDVHYNRAPIDGEVILIQHTPGTAIGLNTPSSTITNERNTVVIRRDDGIMVGIVQIAARGVSRCIVTVKEGEIVKRGQIIGKIRWGSQLDMIIPRTSIIKVREGEQVNAGSSVVAEYYKE